jgi:hypothetical protein
VRAGPYKHARTSPCEGLQNLRARRRSYSVRLDKETSMHTPTPGHPDSEDQDGDVRQPPVPPDREEEIVPIEEPPKPGRGSDAPPMIATARRVYS